MTNSVTDDTKAVERLIGVGSEIAGGVAGAAIGLFAAGPAGAIAGGAAGPLITHTLRALAVELKQRVLAQREEVRVGATIAYAAVKIQQKIEAGEQIRQDAFFHEQPDDRSAAQEIFEGVLLIAQREYQEKKLTFYGNLLASLAFRPDVGRDLANALIRQAEGMSYRQICLLSLCIRKGEFPTQTEEQLSPTKRDEPSWLSLEGEANILHQHNILGGLQGADGYYAVLPFGKLLYDLMELEDLEQADLKEISAMLLASSA
jgi:hypothetical protein